MLTQTVPLILLSLFSSLSCKIAKNPSDVSYMFISTAVTTMSLYRDAKDGEITGIILENKHLNRLETNLECVIIKFNHGLSVF